MVVFAFFGGQSLLAQAPTGTISGVVKDSTGAVMPGAAMTVTNTDTGMKRSGTTAANGTYLFPALPVGTYEMRAEHPGFQREVRSELKLGLGQDAVIHFTLQVGAFEPSAFSLPAPGFVGNLGRAFGTGPGIVKLDLVLAKNIPVSERVNVRFRPEFFNIWNRANFENPGSGVFDARTRAVSPTVGRITSTSTISRQIQFGLRVAF